MQFLKGLFWILLAVLVTVLAYSNWTTAKIFLWSGLVAEVNLPLLLLVAFLIGLVPTLIYQHTMRWRLRQRLANAERTVADLRAAVISRTPEPAPEVVDDAPPMPPGAA